MFGQPCYKSRQKVEIETINSRHCKILGALPTLSTCSLVHCHCNSCLIAVIHSFIHSFIHSLTHSLIHSLHLSPQSM